MQRRYLLKAFPQAVPILLGFVWLVGAVKGMTMLWDYENTPGTAGSAPQQWPHKSAFLRPVDRSTLVMTVHPKCPCTRASLNELALLMTRLHGRIAVYVLFYKPREFAENWEKTDLWQSAAIIPGVALLTDNEGMEARRFGAVTSGQTMLYSASGKLLFSGGLTPARGHIGDSLGFQAIVYAVTHNRAIHTVSAVYGCSLRSPLDGRTSWKK